VIITGEVLMKIIFLFTALLLVSFSDCSNEATGVRSDNSDLKKIHFIDNVSDTTLPDDNISITSVQITADVMSVAVQYSGGCREHFIEMYSEKLFMESNPVQLRMRLSHDDNNDACEMIVSDTLYFDLKPVKELFSYYYRGSSGEMYIRIYDTDMKLYKPGILYRF
jgi:hypothetical protein